jgi:superfamily II DNA or RNA helicase
MKLAPFQQKAVKDLHKEFSDQKMVGLAYYTGAGKTNIFLQYIKEYLQKHPKNKVGISAFITNEIRKQVGERLKEFGLDGIEVDNHKKFYKDHSVYVFTPQIFLKHGPDFKFDLLVIDESHVGLNDDNIMLPKVLSQYCHRETKVLFVSATIWDLVANKKYKNMPVLKRSIEDGMQDGFVGDIDFQPIEALISFKAKDFTREGDLRRKVIETQFKIIKSSCIQKMRYIVKNHSDQIGDKCLVICPPGNENDISRSLSDIFGGRYVMGSPHSMSGNKHIAFEAEMQNNIDSFIKDKKERFLYVVNKCQTGFDMRNMTSIIDLTMTKNIKLLAQRNGRLARKFKDRKTYFYAYDKSMTQTKLDWLILTMVDFCMGNWEGWTTERVKFRKMEKYHRDVWKEFNQVRPLSKVMEALKNKSAFMTGEKTAFVDYKPPTFRTLPVAIEQMKGYISRTDMWRKNPALYKWFRLYAKDSMDKHFPIKLLLGKWHEQTVIAALERALADGCNSRKKFEKMYPGAYEYLYKKDRHDLLDKYLPITYIKWNDDKIVALIKTLNKWNDIRKYPGAYGYLKENSGKLPLFKKMFYQMKPLATQRIYNKTIGLRQTA